MDKWSDSNFNEDPEASQQELAVVAASTNLREEQVQEWFTRFPGLREGTVKPKTAFECTYLSHHLCLEMQQAQANHPNQYPLFMRVLSSGWLVPVASECLGPHGSRLQISIPIMVGEEVPSSPSLASTAESSSTGTEESSLVTTSPRASTFGDSVASESELSSEDSDDDSQGDPVVGAMYSLDQNSSSFNVRVQVSPMAFLKGDSGSVQSLAAYKPQRPQSLAEVRHNLEFQGKVLRKLESEDEYAADYERDSNDEDDTSESEEDTSTNEGEFNQRGYLEDNRYPLEERYLKYK